MPITEHADKVVVSLPDHPDTTVEILKFGATVTSWTQQGAEQLWLSDAARLDGSKAVRGGIPLVFPVFGKQKQESHPTYLLPQHGFARNSTWEFLGQTSESPLTVQFGLGPDNVDPETLKLWGNGEYDFTLLLSVSLEDNKLTSTIEVENTSRDKPFEFNWLFHTYYRTPDVTDTLVTNLIDQECRDQLLGETYTEKAPVVSFHEEFDRIYQNVPEDKVMQVVQFGKVLHNVKRVNLPDAVVWNPWIKKSEGMADFEPKDGYKNMLCIEPGHVHDMVKLGPGKKWQAAQIASLGGDIKLQSNIF
ncbi:glucose-6-phosphate 1-epimerase [Diutina catenulata]